MAEAATTALSVSDLNRQARQALERDFGEIWVEGELSRISRPASGHLYFTLKDDRAQVSCALFRNRARFVAAPMREGDHIRVRAKVSLFEPRGDYQLIVEAVQEAGRGALLAALERLKQKLHDEGVFTNERPLPFPPRQLGIITSASGAAIRDVLAVLKARWPLLAVSVLPVPVQGDQAAPAMIRALAAAARDGRFDALLMTRGGGSLEDLWCFNDEALMRAIHASPIPVMSAVGHEIDSTLADLAADASAPTPSAAAERLVPDQQELRHRLNVLNQRIERAGRYQLDQAQQRLDHARARLRHPGERLEAQRQQLSRLEQRARRAITQRLVREREHLTHDQQRLRAYSPERALQEARTRLAALNRRLEGATTRAVSAQRQRLQASARALNAVSPLGVLERGYAIIEQGDGSVVRRAHDTRPGETLTARLGEGRLKLEVKRRLKQ
ncbi:exodeoxyribonuclease VII large subunit [Kushneria sinocarnis]|uniref:Exodeoxyribonuclease 7 large subunit n=1 Tax=Kushneria sinocarnis TaxID=595502 RepID=A0A420WZF3_9GAMM|nr:exodeoxyribonuclease VII large subunit [Kushneria sinocarnis]RKR06726.1 exodeoxyribonuclease VII large subunit [Kushneria sinocarnis]